MLNSHFYHATIRKLVAAFGTVFNNISVVRKDQAGKVINIQRVPLAYGPKQKFLARIDEQSDLQGPKVAIKLPRMSFEIVTMTYDATTKINRNNTISVGSLTDPSARTVVRQFAPYRMGVQLSIMAKNQDDALQIVEQILPYFQPEYTITIKDVEGMNISNDVPIVLTSITMNEEYEGDFMTRRAIIYTLDFELRVRFYGPTSESGIIKNVIVDFIDSTTLAPIERLGVRVDPPTAAATDSYTVLKSVSFFTATDSFYLDMQLGSGNYSVGEIVTGSMTATTAKVISWANNRLLVHGADGPFHVAESVVGGISSTVREVGAVVPTYD